MGNLIIQVETKKVVISVPTPVRVGTIFGLAGGDLAGAYPNPTVAALTETGGPTQLVITGIPDLTLLRRNGATIEGVAMASGAPPDVAVASAVGVSINPARADHTHGHGDQLGGTLHALALPSGASGFLSGTDKALLDSITGPFGDVLGPAVATANAVARFQGTSGKIVQNSLVIVDNVGNLTLPGTVDGRDVSADGVALDAHLIDLGNPHAVTSAQAGAIALAEKGAANGVATLDAGSKIPAAQLPAIAITDTFVVASEAAMLLLAAETGDVAIRTDLPDTFILAGADPTILADWQILLHPADVVTSVNGNTGVVILAAVDVGAIPAAEKGAANGVATLDGSGLLTAAQFTAAVHGNLAGGTLHSIATGAVAGFLSATDKTKLDGVAAGATNTPLTATAPVNVTKAAAVVGVSGEAARQDHKHDVTTAVVVNVGTVNAEGASAALARADHVHAHGNQAGGALHADVIAAGAAGFMTGADKTKLDSVVVLPAPQTAVAGGTTTTPSPTDVALAGMSITPGAGDYLVSFGTTVSNSINNDIIVSIYLNAVQVANSEREQLSLGAGDGSTLTLAEVPITGVLAGQAVEIRWRTTGGTSTARARNLTLVQVA